MEPGVYHQGIWSFDDFQDYLDNWIIPNMLRDLETVFEGTCDKWLAEGQPENGRGDFVLATALFALFDHLGAFLAESEDASLHTRDNISRTARKLNSTKDIDLILAHFGRNALVHGAWPQTTLLMDNETWAFGLNIFAHPDETSHKALYKRHYPFTDKNGNTRQFQILKLRLNIRFLRRELDACIKNNSLFTQVEPKVFKRIRKIAIDSSNDTWSDFFKQRNSKRNGTVSPTVPFRIAIEKQIKNQLNEAIKQGIW